MYVYKAAVVGAGAMGAEIAQVITFAGLPVVLKDVEAPLVEAAVGRVEAIYRRRVERGRMDARAAREKLDLLEPTTSYDSFADVDLVIEAVPERMDLKKRVMAELDQVCPSNAILASNTSALSISEMGAATRRPPKVIGLHFFHPAHVMKLVEVIPGLDTSADTIDTAVQFAESLRKLPVQVNECAGFLVNRVLAPYLNEAVRCLEEGLATPAEIDDAVRAAGMPMGPLALADMLGLDLCLDVGRQMYEEYGERLRPADLLAELVSAGYQGDKVGRGFHSWAQEGKLPPAKEGGAFDLDRLFLPMINEAIVCLQEGVAAAQDINIAMQAGAGMPKGPLAMADERGLDEVLAGLERLRAEHGERFRPAPLLKRKVRAGHLGIKAGRGFGEYR